MAKNLLVLLALVSVMAAVICSVSAENCKYANGGKGECNVENKDNSGCGPVTHIIHGCKKVESPEYCCCTSPGKERCETAQAASTTTAAPAST